MHGRMSLFITFVGAQEHSFAENSRKDCLIGPKTKKRHQVFTKDRRADAHKVKKDFRAEAQQTETNLVQMHIEHRGILVPMHKV